MNLDLSSLFFSIKKKSFLVHCWIFIEAQIVTQLIILIFLNNCIYTDTYWCDHAWRSMCEELLQGRATRGWDWYLKSLSLSKRDHNNWKPSVRITENKTNPCLGTCLLITPQSVVWITQSRAVSPATQPPDLTAEIRKERPGNWGQAY